MKKLNELAGKPLKFKPNTNLAPADLDFINAVFAELKAIFPAWGVAYKSKEQELKARKVWAKGLIDAKCTTPKQIGRALSKARFRPSDFLPSLGVFIEWSKATPEEVGLPSFEDSYSQAVGNKSSRHPAVIFGLRKLDNNFGFKSLPEKDAKKAWQKQWQRVCDFIDRGGKIPQPEKQLEKKPPPRNLELNKTRIAQLQAMLRGGK